MQDKINTSSLKMATKREQRRKKSTWIAETKQIDNYHTQWNEVKIHFEAIRRMRKKMSYEFVCLSNRWYMRPVLCVIVHIYGLLYERSKLFFFFKVFYSPAICQVSFYYIKTLECICVYGLSLWSLKWETHRRKDSEETLKAEAEDNNSRASERKKKMRKFHSDKTRKP